MTPQSIQTAQMVQMSKETPAQEARSTGEFSGTAAKALNKLAQNEQTQLQRFEQKRLERS
jgi:hypothetical protein